MSTITFTNGCVPRPFENVGQLSKFGTVPRPTRVPEYQTLTTCQNITFTKGCVPRPFENVGQLNKFGTVPRPPRAPEYHTNGCVPHQF